MKQDEITETGYYWLIEPECSEKVVEVSSFLGDIIVEFIGSEHSISLSLITGDFYGPIKPGAIKT